jgi:hypothetical protein
MLSQRDRDRLDHMLEHAREAITLTQGKTRADLDCDRVLSLALVRSRSLVKLPDEFRKTYVLAILRFPGLRSSACATGSFTDMMQWIMIFSGRSSLTICQRS